MTWAEMWRFTYLYVLKDWSVSNSSANVVFLSFFVNLPEKNSDEGSITVPIWINIEQNDWQ